jgi:hypothetical protein
MPRTIRFHLDEHIHPGIADGLRRRDIDVTTTPEAGLEGADDTVHIAFAISAGRVILTHDADFLRLHRQGMPHAGIAYCHQQRLLGDILHHLVLMWEVLDPEDMSNKVEYL